MQARLTSGNTGDVWLVLVPDNREESDVDLGNMAVRFIRDGVDHQIIDDGLYGQIAVRLAFKPTTTPTTQPAGPLLDAPRVRLLDMG